MVHHGNTQTKTGFCGQNNTIKPADMQKFLLTSICFIFLCTNTPSKTYWELYPGRLEDTKHFYTVHKHIIDSIVKKYNYNPAFVFSIVAPEISRFNNLKNTIEHRTVEMLYVNFGTDYSDFSIGFFQMKLSFIEQLEQLVNKSSRFNRFDFICQFSDTIPASIRRERVNRLRSLKWDLHYLCLCYNIINSRFAKKKYDSELQRLKFIATAYNRGFLQDEAEITKWMKIRSFPNEVFGENYPYGTVSKDFYVVF